MRATASTDAATTAPAAGLLPRYIHILRRFSGHCHRARRRTRRLILRSVGISAHGVPVWCPPFA